MSIYQPKGEYFTTYSNKKFYFSHPHPEMLCLEDIAHALAYQCRFGGHAKHFYSVAEHSVLISHLVPAHIAAEGLFHDAAEAYYGDIIRPLKQLLVINADAYNDIWTRRERFKALENKCLRCIFEKYFLTWPVPDRITGIDIKLLGMEYDKLIDEVRPSSLYHISKLDLAGYEIAGYLPAKAEKLFLARAIELGIKR